MIFLFHPNQSKHFKSAAVVALRHLDGDLAAAMKAADAAFDPTRLPFVLEALLFYWKIVNIPSCI